MKRTSFLSHTSGDGYWHILAGDEALVADVGETTATADGSEPIFMDLLDNRNRNQITTNQPPTKMVRDWMLFCGFSNHQLLIG